MCDQYHRHLILCILPPYVLHSIAQKGKPKQRAWAVQTLAADNTFRAMRLAITSNRIERIVRLVRPTLVPEGQKQRSIFDARHTQDLPGHLVHAERDGPSKDAAVNEAYDGLGATYDFFWEVFERHSIDDEGLPLNAAIHFGKNYDNAFWDGSQMVFGDGDGDLFNRFTIALDVISHELTHGVTEDEAGLVYSSQSGALNESLSDVFGALVKQYVKKQTADQADWLIGEGLFTKKVNGVALRSMKAPGTAFDDPVLGHDPQPAHMRDFVRTFNDNGGAHINSGIPNHAFYQLAMMLGGHAWEKAGRIWYETLKDARLRRNSGFRSFAKLNYSNARRLYGAGSAEHSAVCEAWSKVGITIN